MRCSGSNNATKYGVCTKENSIICLVLLLVIGSKQKAHTLTRQRRFDVGGVWWHEAGTRTFLFLSLSLSVTRSTVTCCDCEIKGRQQQQNIEEEVERGERRKTTMV